MKAIIIYINFVLSFVSLSIGIVGAIWFLVACVILIRANRNGTMDKLNDKLGLDDL